MYGRTNVCSDKEIILFMKYIVKLITIIYCLVAVAGCSSGMTEEEITGIGLTPCRNPALFIKNVGFNPARTAFSTTELNYTGVALVELPQNPNDKINRRVWQDSSWKLFGHMASLTTDENGSAYTAPIPLVNNLDVPVSELNNIYKIDYITGKMALFCQLPKPKISNDIVPFGVLGVYYDCHGKKLYAASISGSSRDQEKGVIYVIDINTAKIIDQLEGYDAAGLFVGGNTGEKRLYFGGLRKSNIYSVELNKEGKFKNAKVTTEFSLEQLGPRGNDKARRIRYDKLGNLVIQGVEFDYSLAAQSNRNETTYQFNFNEEEKKWKFYKIMF